MIVRNSDNVVVLGNNSILNSDHAIDMVNRRRRTDLNATNATFYNVNVPYDFKPYLYTFDGTNFAYTEKGISESLKIRVISEIKNEGLRRIQVEMPAISDFDFLEFIKEFWLSIDVSARSATVKFQKIIDIYQAGKDSIAVIKAESDQATIAAYDVNSDPAWPV